MIRDIKAIYTSAWSFALACPLLFLVPVLVEFAQHVVELQLGMYDGREGAQLAEASALRMQFGFAKTLALLLPGYWFTRYVMFGRDRARAARPEWPAIGLWGILFAIGTVQLAWGLFGPSLATLTSLEGDMARNASMILAAVEQVVMIYLTAWFVAWPLGNARIGPFASVRIMSGSFWHTLALMIAGILPLMALHYGAAIAAVLWTPAILDWVLMIADSLLVGLLAVTMTGSGVYAARHAARRKGVELLPAGEAEGAGLLAAS